MGDHAGVARASQRSRSTGVPGMAAASAARTARDLAGLATCSLRPHTAAAAAAPAARCLTVSTAACGKVKVAVRDAPPPGWKWGGDQRANSAAYNRERKAWRESVAAQRRDWQTYVVQHEDRLAAMKAERDAARFAAQAEALQRQFDRWKIPTHLRTSQQRRSNPAARRASYARHALRQALAQTSRAVQTQKLLNESSSWVAPDKIDAAIAAALDSPEELYADCLPWDDPEEVVPNFVEGFEGPDTRPRRQLPNEDDNEPPRAHGTRHNRRF